MSFPNTSPLIYCIGHYFKSLCSSKVLLLWSLGLRRFKYRSASAPTTTPTPLSIVVGPGGVRRFRFWDRETSARACRGNLQNIVHGLRGNLQNIAHGLHVSGLHGADRSGREQLSGLRRLPDAVGSPLLEELHELHHILQRPRSPRVHSATHLSGKRHHLRDLLLDLVPALFCGMVGSKILLRESLRHGCPEAVVVWEVWERTMRTCLPSCSATSSYFSFIGMLLLLVLHFCLHDPITCATSITCSPRDQWRQIRMRTTLVGGLKSLIKVVVDKIL